MWVHDNSYCHLIDGKISSYLMEERMSRIKHDSGSDHILNYLTKIKAADKVCCNNRGKYFPYEIDETIFTIESIRKSIDCKYFWFDHTNHHKYHAYCGFFNSNFDDALCFVFDGSGSVIQKGNLGSIQKILPYIKDNEAVLERESIYQINRERKEVEILKSYKVVKNGDEGYYEYTDDNRIDIWIDESTQITTDNSVGWKYEKLCLDNGFDWFDGGKMMGLGQYKEYKHLLPPKYSTKEWRTLVDAAYDLQIKTQNYVLSTVKKYVEKTGIKNVVITGGYALNCVANSFYLKNLKGINFYIDPICFDAGISIGSSYYHTEDRVEPLSNVYLGYKEETYDLTHIDHKKTSYSEVAELLSNGKSIAIFQGKSEAGQRALGNRSLLFDPRKMDGKDIVNKIKRREEYRPFAASVLIDHCNEWFDMIGMSESPYMMFALDAWEYVRNSIPAVVHVDGTSRIQTVDEKRNLHFYKLIESFYNLTGVPMVLNTSFNLAGDPLVETFEDAINTLNNSEIDYLYLPEMQLLMS